MLHVFISIWKTWGKRVTENMTSSASSSFSYSSLLCTSKTFKGNQEKYSFTAHLIWAGKIWIMICKWGFVIWADIHYESKLSLALTLSLSLCTSATPVLLFKIKRLQTTKRGLVEKPWALKRSAPCVLSGQLMAGHKGNITKLVELYGIVSQNAKSTVFNFKVFK